MLCKIWQLLSSIPCKKNATNVWSEFLLKKSELDLAKAQLQAAEIAYEGIIQEYENGSRDTLDVLNSRSLLLIARLNFADIERISIDLRKLPTFRLG